MKPQDLRDRFVKFFEDKGHKHLPSSSLVPQDDPSVLLTTAGMQQFKKWYTRVEEPKFAKVVTIQKCVRIDDIEEVGDKTHFSFFEMLGNFSFGDYFKEEAIDWAIEFITEDLGIKFEDLYFTFFTGDGETPRDEESLKILRSKDIPNNKIVGFDKEDNFWGPTGSEGPCGPTVEIFVGDPRSDGVEIWNLVFNEYYKFADGKYKPLEYKGVDTGAGFERIVTILSKKDNPYETELFSNVIAKIQVIAKEKDKKAEKIIADHLRTATFLLADGVKPSNLDKGYVARRLTRRAIRFGRTIGIEDSFIAQIAKVIIGDYKDEYKELLKNEKEILEEFNKEEKKFLKTLEKGLKEFEKLSKDGEISGKDAFDLFQTHGFPLEMTEELALEKHIGIDKEGFLKEYKKHQEASRKGADKKFKGGLETGGEMETKFHTATHLLHQALRAVLGDHVKQAGSNITADRLRFDFTHPEKMSPEEKTEVENIVNAEIKSGKNVAFEEMSIEEAQKIGAIGLFESRYGEKVTVYSIGEFSKEICGGPHVKNTKELGVFKIKKEESSSQGIRRIKAILE